MDDVLRVSVTQLMSAFRDGLEALIPTAERLDIEWRDEWQHLDWERLARALFMAYVQAPIAADQGHLHREWPLATYDIDASHYMESSWIGVVAGQDRNQPLPEYTALVRLTSRELPFDTVQCVRLNPVDLSPSSTTLIDFADAYFTFVRHSPGGARFSITDIVAVE